MSAKKGGRPTNYSAPKSGGNGFLWAVLAILVVAIVVIASVVWMGRERQSPSQLAGQHDVSSVSMTVVDDAVRFTANESAPEVDIYEDYSCHYCAQLPANSVEDMTQALVDGELTVNFRNLRFLDRGEDDRHSSRSQVAAMVIANSGDAQLFYDFHSFLMERQQQTANYSYEELAKAAADLGASDEIVQQITDADGKDAALAQSDANATKLEGVIGQVSSPHVIYEGTDIAGDLSGTWVATVTG